eukprot:scaffold75719_cov71-Phaeocystis_antarctica.AAC.2
MPVWLARKKVRPVPAIPPPVVVGTEEPAVDFRSAALGGVGHDREGDLVVDRRGRGLVLGWGVESTDMLQLLEVEVVGEDDAKVACHRATARPEQLAELQLGRVVPRHHALHLLLRVDPRELDAGHIVDGEPVRSRVDAVAASSDVAAGADSPARASRNEGVIPHEKELIQGSELGPALDRDVLLADEASVDTCHRLDLRHRAETNDAVLGRAVALVAVASSDHGEGALVHSGLHRCHRLIGGRDRDDIALALRAALRLVQLVEPGCRVRLNGDRGHGGGRFRGHESFSRFGGRSVPFRNLGCYILVFVNLELVHNMIEYKCYQGRESHRKASGKLSQALTPLCNSRDRILGCRQCRQIWRTVHVHVHVKGAARRCLDNLSVRNSLTYAGANPAQWACTSPSHL